MARRGRVSQREGAMYVQEDGMTIEIGGNVLAAVVVAGLVLLVVEWWRFRSIGRGR